MFFTAGFCFLFGQFGHLLLYVSDLTLHALVLLFLPVLTVDALVSFLCYLLQVLLQTSNQTLENKWEKVK